MTCYYTMHKNSVVTNAKSLEELKNALNSLEILSVEDDDKSYLGAQVQHINLYALKNFGGSEPYFFTDDKEEEIFSYDQKSFLKVRNGVWYTERREELRRIERERDDVLLSKNNICDRKKDLQRLDDRTARVTELSVCSAKREYPELFINNNNTFVDEIIDESTSREDAAVKIADLLDLDMTRLRKIARLFSQR